MRIWKSILVLLFLCSVVTATYAQSCNLSVTSNPSSTAVNIITQGFGADNGGTTPFSLYMDPAGPYVLDIIQPWVGDWTTGHYTWLWMLKFYTDAFPDYNGWHYGTGGCFVSLEGNVQIRIEAFSPSEPLLPVDNNLSVNANQAVTFTWTDGIYDGDSTPGISPDYYDITIKSTDNVYSHVFANVHGYSLTILPSDANHLLINKNYTWNVKAGYYDTGTEFSRYNYLPDSWAPVTKVMHFTTVDGPLPVELSSFTATATASHFVSLNWTTQTETNLAGYYVYKNTANDLENAACISTMINPTNTSQETNYSFIDDNVQNGNTYFYWLQNLDLSGETGFFGPVSVILVNDDNGESAPEVPNHISLLPAYPNPFGSQTILPYKLTAPGEVRIEVFNSKGQLIRNFSNSHTAAGVFRFTWNGSDNDGRAISSGIYTYRMTSGKFTASRKVVFWN